MGFIKVIFVLLIILPVAVLMMYLINKLNDDMKASAKKENRDKPAAREKEGGKVRYPEERYDRNRYEAGMRQNRTSLIKQNSRQQIYNEYGKQRHEKPETEAAKASNSKSAKANNNKSAGAMKTEKPKQAGSVSKRKRRKERKNNRKVREQKK